MLTLTGVTLRRLLLRGANIFQWIRTTKQFILSAAAFRLTWPLVFFFQYKTFCTASLPNHIRSCTADLNKWVQGKKKNPLEKKKSFPVLEQFSLWPSQVTNTWHLLLHRLPLLCPCGRTGPSPRRSCGCWSTQPSWRSKETQTMWVRNLQDVCFYLYWYYSIN